MWIIALGVSNSSNLKAQLLNLGDYLGKGIVDGQALVADLYVY
jgi:hypothetical protein